MKATLVTLIFATTLLISGGAIAQEEDVSVSEVVIGVDQEEGAIANVNNSDEFIEMMRAMMGDRIAERIQEKFDELDDDERARLEAEFEDQDFKHFSVESDGLDGLGAIVAILAITLSLGMPIILLLLVLYFSYRKRRQRAELIQSFVNAGKDVPEQLLEDTNSGNPLRSGLNLIAVGSALAIAFYIVGAPEAAGFALIPAFIGVARVIYYFSDRSIVKG